MAQTTRSMPVRTDDWRPDDEIIDGIIRRCVAEAEDAEARDGTREYMAGALILAVLAVVIIGATGSVPAAVVVTGLIAAGGACYMLSATRPAPAERKASLAAIGGPGRLPAGYLVHPAAWEAGMADHVAHVPESQLRAAAELCHAYPGTVDDLLIFTGNLAIHVPATRPAGAADVERRAHALVRLGLPVLREHAARTPVPAGATGKKGR